MPNKQQNNEVSKHSLPANKNIRNKFNQVRVIKLLNSRVETNDLQIIYRKFPIKLADNFTRKF